MNSWFLDAQEVAKLRDNQHHHRWVYHSLDLTWNWWVSHSCPFASHSVVLARTARWESKLAWFSFVFTWSCRLSIWRRKTLIRIMLRVVKKLVFIIDETNTKGGHLNHVLAGALSSCRLSSSFSPLPFVHRVLSRQDSLASFFFLFLRVIWQSSKTLPRKSSSEQVASGHSRKTDDDDDDGDDLEVDHEFWGRSSFQFYSFQLFGYCVRRPHLNRSKNFVLVLSVCCLIWCDVISSVVIRQRYQGEDALLDFRVRRQKITLCVSSQCPSLQLYPYLPKVDTGPDNFSMDTL